MGRRLNGEGSVLPTPEGRFRARLTLRNGKRLSRTFDRKSAASAWIRETKEADIHNNYIEPSTIRLTEWWNTWVEVYKAKSVGPATLETYAASKKRLDKDLLERCISEIARADIQRELNRISETHSRRTVEITRTAMNMCFAQAVSDLLIPKNPVSKTQLPAPEPHKDKVAHVGAVTDIMEKIDSPIRIRTNGHEDLNDIRQRPYWEALGFILFSGLRRGECVGLEWTDWDPKKPAKILVRGTKTKNAYRVAGLSPECERILALRQHRKISSRFIFTDYHGRPLDAKALYHFAKRHIGETVHSLRHTYSTNAANAGVNPRALQKQLGHAKISTTLQIYVEVSEDELMKAAAETAAEIRKKVQ